jgi:DNA-binding NarL/FixJ family response regulator
MSLRCQIISDSPFLAQGVQVFLDLNRVTLVESDKSHIPALDLSGIQNIDLAILVMEDREKIVRAIEELKYHHQSIKTLVLLQVRTTKWQYTIEHCADYLFIEEEINAVNINRAIDEIYDSQYVRIRRLNKGLTISDFSVRQLDVMSLLQLSQSTPEICMGLSISRDTAQKHFRNCADRLGVDNNRQSIAVASMRSIGDLSDLYVPRSSFN